MTAPLLAYLLFLRFPSSAPVADTHAIITAQMHGEEHCWPVVVGNGTVLRASPEIGWIAGREWADIRRQCRTLDWPIFEFSLPRGKPVVRFRITR